MIHYRNDCWKGWRGRVGPAVAVLPLIMSMLYDEYITPPVSIITFIIAFVGRASDILVREQQTELMILCGINSSNE